MVSRLRSRWQKISKPLDTVIISFIVVLIALVILSILGYLFRWEWTGLTPSISPLHPTDSDIKHHRRGVQARGFIMNRVRTLHYAMFY